jgi:hypothetical protein
MRHLKTYESHNIKQQIIDQVNQTIDDAMRSLEDEGFEEIKFLSNDSSYVILRKYVRSKRSKDLIQLTGKIKSNGDIKWNDSFEYDESHLDYSLIQEFMNSISLIHGISGIDIQFSFTNFYDEDKIIIYTNV